MKRLAEFAISLALGGLILDAVLRHFDLRQTMECVRRARPGLLSLGAGLMVAAYLLRGVRWRIWERSLSYWNSLRLILIGFMGNNILPARLGEILRAHCAAAKTTHDRGRTTALASIVAERVLDGTVLGVFGLVAVVAVPVDRRLRWALLLASLAFAGLMWGLILGIRHHRLVRSFISAGNWRFPARVAAFVREKANQFLDGFLALGTLPRMLGAIATTAVVWGLESGFYHCVGLAVWEGMTVRA